jgi:hypothetical protein
MNYSDLKELTTQKLAQILDINAIILKNLFNQLIEKKDIILIFITLIFFEMDRIVD